MIFQPCESEHPTDEKSPPATARLYIASLLLRLERFLTATCYSSPRLHQTAMRSLSAALIPLSYEVADGASEYRQDRSDPRTRFSDVGCHYLLSREEKTKNKAEGVKLDSVKVVRPVCRELNADEGSQLLYKLINKVMYLPSRPNHTYESLKFQNTRTFLGEGDNVCKYVLVSKDNRKFSSNDHGLALYFQPVSCSAVKIKNHLPGDISLPSQHIRMQICTLSSY
ncbi:unnamed protein product [Nesidiocoris tenuis]|uniref:Uncharacterized protein n=1 Tax=Nesidiocoris tenuis TaxID=355587 RepID=A0A6H5GJU9_9HEMI|nr:unnamed protein product [Nesidiocoris tenuis]CAB0004230.1 unnamed protein product [Nesidiocoris tenuis]